MHIGFASSRLEYEVKPPGCGENISCHALRYSGCTVEVGVVLLDVVYAHVLRIQKSERQEWLLVLDATSQWFVADTQTAIYGVNEAIRHVPDQRPPR